MLELSNVFIEFKFMIMKTLKYILMGILFIAIIPLCNSQVPGKSKQVITLKSVPENVSVKLLSESKEILLKRLAFMRLRDIQITQNDKRSELVVSVNDTISHKTLSELLLIQGHLKFYCVSAATDTLNEHDILEAHADLNNPKQAVLTITFKENAWKMLENTTSRNKNKPLMFVMDNKVYSTPVISDVISHGKISLTGSGFSSTEVRKLAAIISGGTLPLNFTVVSNN